MLARGTRGDEGGRGGVGADNAHKGILLVIFSRCHRRICPISPWPSCPLCEIRGVSARLSTANLIRAGMCFLLSPCRSFPVRHFDICGKDLLTAAHCFPFAASTAPFFF